MNAETFNQLIRQIKYSEEALRAIYEHYFPLIVRYIEREYRGKLDWTIVKRIDTKKRKVVDIF